MFKYLLLCLLVVHFLSSLTFAQEAGTSTLLTADAPTGNVLAAPSLPKAKNPKSIAVLDFWEDFEKGFAGDLGYFEEHCGYSLEKSYDPANLSLGTTEEDTRIVSAWCAAPLQELVNICGKGEAQRAIVQSKIKKITCRFLGDTGKRSLVLDGDNLVWSFEYNSQDDQATFIKKALSGLL